jgi:hypothetical protein
MTGGRIEICKQGDRLKFVNCTSIFNLMKIAEIIKEIRSLPIADRMYVVEKTIRSIRAEESRTSMYLAAEALQSDYLTDTELTAFSRSRL